MGKKKHETLSKGEVIAKGIMDRVRRELEQAKGQWGRLHRISGIPHRTIAAIASGEIRYPHIDTVAELARYLGMELTTQACAHFNKYPQS